MGLIFYMTFNHKETFLSILPPIVGMHPSGPHEQDHMMVYSLLIGENLPFYGY